ncbi:MAG TPA: BNR-4 repeat-containing protein [Candidatus Hydrogenedentes bacterium]|nr:BNR-4 repeat-containing protein [Candidatus Hydrogenedentota bacterium]
MRSEKWTRLRGLGKRFAVAAGWCLLLTAATGSCWAQIEALSEIRDIALDEDGGWCWFEGPRAVVHNGLLLAGSVASGHREPDRKGDIDLIVFDLRKEQASRVELYDRLQLDDHDSPAIARLMDGRWLAVFARHGNDPHFYYRLSEPDNPLKWSEVKQYAPSPTTRLTYSNVFQLPRENGKIYNFFRGLDDSFKPSWVCSTDGGITWNTGNVFIRVPSEKKHRPYVRYVSDGWQTVHMAYTEGHPRDWDNSIYHVFYRAGMLHNSAGEPLAPLGQGLDSPDKGTRVFQGHPDAVAWCNDIALDRDGAPVIAYSVQMNSAGLPPRSGGLDMRYRWARWDGSSWRDYPLAYAGERLYPGEDDYTGLVSLVPGMPHIVLCSTNSNPVSGEPLISRADGKRHYEIFLGVTRDGGKTWIWRAVTRDSDRDNLRPIALCTETEVLALYLSGTFRAFTDYAQAVRLARIPITSIPD